MKFRRSLFALLLSAALVAGCGTSGPTEKQRIAAVIKAEGVTPSSLCAHLTDSLLSRLGGKNGCLHQATLAPSDPTTRATAIKVSGHTASAVVVDRAGTRTINLVKEKGVWKVAGVG